VPVVQHPDERAHVQYLGLTPGCDVCKHMELAYWFLLLLTDATRCVLCMLTGLLNSFYYEVLTCLLLVSYQVDD